MAQFIIIITILKKLGKKETIAQESETAVCTVEESILKAQEGIEQTKQILQAQECQSADIETAEDPPSSDPKPSVEEEPQKIPPCLHPPVSSLDNMENLAAMSEAHSISDTDGSQLPQTPPKPLSPFENAQILVCEDHEQNREVMDSVLREFGIEPRFAVNGLECIDILNSGKMFDIIFMDLQMPLMDGYEAARLIRSNYKYDAIPIIGMTANVMREVINKCFETGMNDHIAKPVEFDRLEYVLAKWLPEEIKISI